MIKYLFSEPGLRSQFNQDVAGSSGSSIWVIDGITEVSPLPLKNNVDSVVWFVNIISLDLELYH
ncbi:MAG: hypothetical protein ACXADY_04905 [Candidatus Hodarchaeales archaeon]